MLLQLAHLQESQDDSLWMEVWGQFSSQVFGAVGTLFKVIHARKFKIDAKNDLEQVTV